MISEQLLRDLIASAEEFRERLYDDRRDCRAMGQDRGELAVVKLIRYESSLIRKARRALLEVMEKESKDGGRHD